MELPEELKTGSRVSAEIAYLDDTNKKEETM
jgi:hypothetical protein